MNFLQCAMEEKILVLHHVYLKSLPPENVVHLQRITANVPEWLSVTVCEIKNMIVAFNGQFLLMLRTKVLFFSKSTY